MFLNMFLTIMGYGFVLYWICIISMLIVNKITKKPQYIYLQGAVYDKRKRRLSR
jgi:hypothetical protein